MMNLKSREKKIVAICVALVLAAVVHIFLIAPSIEKRDKVDRSLRKAQMQLDDLRILEREYSQIIDELERITRQTGGTARSFDLWAFLSRTADKIEIKDNIDSRKTSRTELGSNLTESKIVFVLKGISLEKLVGFLHEIETKGAAVAVARIKILPGSKPTDGLRVEMTVTSIGAT